MKERLKVQTKNGLFIIRPVEQADNQFLTDIIVTGLAEFGATGEGFACNDAETQTMFEAYQDPNRKYYTLLKACSDQCKGCSKCTVVGGAGIAPLKSSKDICEFVKMYYRPAVRGLGLGKIMLELCIEKAQKMGYKRMYLETLERMTTARRLYEKYEFKQIESSQGCTGHYSCDAFYVRDL